MSDRKVSPVQAEEIEDCNKFFPAYYFKRAKGKKSVVKKVLFAIAKKFLELFCQLILDPRGGKVGKLTPDEVEEVYNREAKKYDLIHHMTTCGQDLAWRRKAGFFVINFILNCERRDKIRLLDLCTGTGLCLKEIDRVLGSWGINNCKLEAIALDYCEEMLKVARKNLNDCHNMSFDLVRGDATILTKESDEFVSFETSSIDLVTQVFGIGGIDKPQEVLREVLKILKPDGQFYLVDMHSPIGSLPGEWFCFYRWLQMPIFETKTYEEITLPLVLKRKWAWRDTTALFYQIRLITFRETEEEYYGFEVINFAPESQRWWFSLPIMPVASITVKKVKLDRLEFEKRNNIIRKTEV